MWKKVIVLETNFIYNIEQKLRQKIELFGSNLQSFYKQLYLKLLCKKNQLHCPLPLILETLRRRCRTEHKAVAHVFPSQR